MSGFCNSRLGAPMEGARQLSSLTCNDLFDGGNCHARKNEHHCQLPN